MGRGSSGYHPTKSGSVGERVRDGRAVRPTTVHQVVALSTAGQCLRGEHGYTRGNPAPAPARDQIRVLRVLRQRNGGARQLPWVSPGRPTCFACSPGRVRATVADYWQRRAAAQRQAGRCPWRFTLGRHGRVCNDYMADPLLLPPSHANTEYAQCWRARPLRPPRPVLPFVELPDAPTLRSYVFNLQNILARSVESTSTETTTTNHPTTELCAPNSPRHSSLTTPCVATRARPGLL